MTTIAVAIVISVAAIAGAITIIITPARTHSDANAYRARAYPHALRARGTDNATPAAARNAIASFFIGTSLLPLYENASRCGPVPEKVARVCALLLIALCAV